MNEIDPREASLLVLMGLHAEPSGLESWLGEFKPGPARAAAEALVHPGSPVDEDAADLVRAVRSEVSG